MGEAAVLSLSKQLVATLARLTETSPTPNGIDLSELQTIANTLLETALYNARHAADAAAQSRIALDLLRSEVNSELVDREANAARIAERQQFLFQRASALPGQASAAERACASAAYVEAALVSLCPHVNLPMAGCATLEAQSI
jgi:hypothetical protein